MILYFCVVFRFFPTLFFFLLQLLRLWLTSPQVMTMTVTVTKTMVVKGVFLSAIVCFNTDGLFLCMLLVILSPSLRDGGGAVVIFFPPPRHNHRDLPCYFLGNGCLCKLRLAMKVVVCPSNGLEVVQTDARN